MERLAGAKRFHKVKPTGALQPTSLPDHYHNNPVGVSWTRLVKKSDDTHTPSDTTLSDVSELQFIAMANARYEVEAWLLYSDSGGGTADIKWAAGEDSTLRGGFNLQGLTTADAFTTSLSIGSNLSDTAAMGTGTAIRMAQVRGFHLGHGGTFKFQYAQNNSTATHTKVLVGSVLHYRWVA